MWLISSFLGCTNRFYIKNCTAKKYWELPAMLFAWRKFNYTRPRRYFCGLFFVRRCPAFGITLQANALRVILNIARSAGPRWILGVLNPQEINFLAKFALHGIFAKIMIFHRNLKFHHRVWNLDPAETLHQNFFRSSRVQNLNPHVKLWYWTKGIVTSTEISNFAPVLEEYCSESGSV